MFNDSKLATSLKSVETLIQHNSFACRKFIHLLHKRKIFDDARYLIDIISKYPVFFGKANKLPNIIMGKFQYLTALYAAVGIQWPGKQIIIQSPR